MDEDVLEKVDQLTKKRQKENLEQNKPLTSRSEVIEQIVRKSFGRTEI